MQIKIDKYNLEYEIVNPELLKENLPCIVMLHEGLGSLQQWKTFPDAMMQEQKFPILMFNRRGYGRSDFFENGIPKDFLRYDAYVSLPGLINALNISNPLILFGHSDGGTISLLAASSPLENLLGIMVEAPHVIIEDKSIGGIKSARSLLYQEDLLERMNKYQHGRAWKLVDAWTSFWLNPEQRIWEMDEELSKIECPILLIQGEDDNFGTFKQLDHIKSKVKSKWIKECRLPQCGHAPHLEKQEEVAAACRRFMNEIAK